jgi:CheY-like chemotaxis protein
MNLADEGEPTTAQLSGETPALRAGVLFLCEDSEDDEFWFKKTFRKAGLSASIQVVPTVRQAIAYLQNCCDTGENIPRLMVLDFRLSDGRCTEVLDFIQKKEQLKDVPVITYSGGLNKEDLQSTSKYGVVAYFEKPLTVEKAETFRPYLR